MAEVDFQSPKGVSEGMECIDSSLDLITSPRKNYSIEKNMISTIYPITPLNTNSNQVFFECPPSSYWTDLYNSYLDMTLKIVTDAGADCPATFTKSNSVAFENLISQVLWKSIKVRIGDTSLTGSHDLMHLTSYLGVLLNFDSSARNTRLHSAGWTDVSNFDANTAHDAIAAAAPEAAVDAAPDSAFKQRSKWTLGGRKKRFRTYIPHYFFATERMLLPMCAFQVELLRNSDNFCLISNAATLGYKIKIESLSLCLRRVVTLPSLVKSMESSLLKAEARYPLRYGYTRAIMIDRHCLRHDEENLFLSNQIPQFCVIGFQLASEFRGNHQSSNLKFPHHNLKTIKLIHDDQTYPSPDGYITEYNDDKTKDHLDAFLGLYQRTLRENAGLIINYENFAQSYCLYAFYTSSDGITGALQNDHISAPREGTVRLTATFDPKHLNEALVCLVYAENDAMIYLNSLRQCTRSYEL